MENVVALSSLLKGKTINGQSRLPEAASGAHDILDKCWNEVLLCTGIRKENIFPPGSWIGITNLALRLNENSRRIYGSRDQ